MTFRILNPFILCATAFLLLAGCAAFLRDDEMFVAALVAMSSIAVLLPIIALFSRDWWRYVMVMTVANIVFTILVIWLAYALDDLISIQPGAGFAFVIPALIYCGAVAISGALRIVAKIVQRRNGDNKDEPFFGSSAKFVLMAIAAFVLLGWVMNIITAIYLHHNADQYQERRSVMPAQAPR